MNLTPEVYVERLSGVLSKKFKLLEEMLELSGKQLEMIHKDGIEELNLLIDNKQLLIGAIDKLDDEFEVYFNRFKRELGVNSLDELQTTDIVGLKELKSKVQEIMKTLEKIKLVDQQCNKNAKVLLDNLGSEIKEMNLAKRAHTGYRPLHSQPVSYFIDKKK